MKMKPEMTPIHDLRNMVRLVEQAVQSDELRSGLHMAFVNVEQMFISVLHQRNALVKKLNKESQAREMMPTAAMVVASHPYLLENPKEVIRVANQAWDLAVLLGARIGAGTRSMQTNPFTDEDEDEDEE